MAYPTDIVGDLMVAFSTALHTQDLISGHENDWIWEGLSSC